MLNQLFHSPEKKDIVSSTVFLIFYAILATLYIFLCFVEPGYVTSNDSRRFRDKYNRPLYENENDETDSSQHHLVNRERVAEFSRENVKEKEKREEEEVILDLETSGKTEIEMEIPALHYCKDCQMEQPLRAKHCHECGKCVARYDHHCFWIGTCVGQKNHCIFWWFLLFESIVCLWGIIILLKVLGQSTDDDVPVWYAGRILTVLLLLAVIFLSFVPISLLVIHTILLVTNQTQWESASREKITYFRNQPSEWLPFNNGVFSNIRLFCCMCGIPVDENLWKFSLQNEDVNNERSRCSKFCHNESYECF